VTVHGSGANESFIWIRGNGRQGRIRSIDEGTAAVSSDITDTLLCYATVAEWSVTDESSIADDNAAATELTLFSLCFVCVYTYLS